MIRRNVHRRPYGLPLVERFRTKEPSYTDWGGERYRFDSLLGRWLAQTFSRPCEGGPLLAWHFITGPRVHSYRNDREWSGAVRDLYTKIWNDGYIRSGSERATRRNEFLPYESGLGEDRYVYLKVLEPHYEGSGYGLAFDAYELIQYGALLGLRDLMDANHHSLDFIFDSATGGRQFGWPPDTNGWNPLVVADPDHERIVRAYYDDTRLLLDPNSDLYRSWIAQSVEERLSRARKALRVRGNEAERLLYLAVDAYCSVEVAGGLRHDEFTPEKWRFRAALHARGIGDEDPTWLGLGAAFNITLNGMEILVEGGLPLSMAILAVEQGRPRWLRPSR